MANTSETIAVVAPHTKDGYAIINKADFDPKTHKQFKGEPKKATTKKNTPAAKSKE